MMVKYAGSVRYNICWSKHGQDDDFEPVYQACPVQEDESIRIETGTFCAITGNLLAK